MQQLSLAKEGHCVFEPPAALSGSLNASTPLIS